jgi:hypothetical protein
VSATQVTLRCRRAAKTAGLEKRLSAHTVWTRERVFATKAKADRPIGRADEVRKPFRFAANAPAGSMVVRLECGSRFFNPAFLKTWARRSDLGACWDVGLDVIEPCSFPLDDKSLKRAALDYGPLTHMIRHDSWERSSPRRNVARAPAAVHHQGAAPFHKFDFQAGDTLLFGNESREAPPEVPTRPARA